MPGPDVQQWQLIGAWRSHQAVVLGQFRFQRQRLVAIQRGLFVFAQLFIDQGPVEVSFREFRRQAHGFIQCFLR